MYEFDEGTELSKYFYEPKEIETANGYTWPMPLRSNDWRKSKENSLHGRRMIIG